MKSSPEFPEKIKLSEAETQKQRTLSDAELVKQGAEYVDQENGEVRMELTPEQIEKIKEELNDESELKRKKEEFEQQKEKLAEEFSGQINSYRESIDNLIDVDNIEIFDLSLKHLENVFKKNLPTEDNIGRLSVKLGLPADLYGYYSGRFGTTKPTLITPEERLENGLDDQAKSDEYIKVPGMIDQKGNPTYNKFNDHFYKVESDAQKSLCEELLKESSEKISSFVQKLLPVLSQAVENRFSKPSSIINEMIGKIGYKKRFGYSYGTDEMSKTSETLDYLLELGISDAPSQRVLKNCRYHLWTYREIKNAIDAFEKSEKDIFSAQRFLSSFLSAERYLENVE
jgi:hypothetical protein